MRRDKRATRATSLARALRDLVKADTPSSRRELLTALSAATLFFPAAPGSDDDHLKLIYLHDEFDRPVLPGFTSRRCLDRWDWGSPYASAPAATFLDWLMEGPFVGLVVNPETRASVFLDRELLAALQSGRAPATFTDEELALLRDWSER